MDSRGRHLHLAAVTLQSFFHLRSLTQIVTGVRVFVALRVRPDHTDVLVAVTTTKNLVHGHALVVSDSERSCDIALECSLWLKNILVGRLKLD